MARDEVRPSWSGAFFRNLALWVVACTFVLAWLPFVRATVERTSYEWGLVWFGLEVSGRGVDAQYWLLPLQAFIAFLTLSLGFRAPSRFSYRLLFFWLGLNAANALHGYLTAPGGLVFRGDTLGVEVDIGLAAAATAGGAFLLALFARGLEFSRGRRPPRFASRRINTILYALALLPAPLQWWLLQRGEQHGADDERGVILTLAQGVTLVFATALGRRRPASP